MAHSGLNQARAAKKDEFYSSYEDIEREMNAYLEHDPDVFRGKTILLPCDDPEWSNFTKFFVTHFAEYGIKKLISTSYAQAEPLSEGEKRGRIFTLTGDTPFDPDNLSWSYLEGDGDFRSAEVTALRDEADIIITNPPFSLFREFMSWVMESECLFSILGNVNAITYREVFPHIRANRVWLGPTISSGDREFRVPQDYPLKAYGCRIDEQGNKFVRVTGVRWFTNIAYRHRREPLPLRTIEENIRHSKHAKVRSQGYVTYDNYDAIEVPFVDAIPSDFVESWGVPLSFLDKCDPAQVVFVNADEPLPTSKVDRGHVYVIREKDRAVVLTRGHTKESVFTLLTTEYGYELDEIDYRSGIMGVPITFLDKHNPEQFEILGSSRWAKSEDLLAVYRGEVNPPQNDSKTLIDGKETYKRLFIRRL